MRIQLRKPQLYLLAGLALMIVACVIPPDQRIGERYRWWAGLGPVLPHDSFPADCRLCHIGEKWHTLTDTFSFDHELRTGVALEGAHTKARCLRCHNDRGPVDVFNAKGCVGCHEDRHFGELGADCTSCHNQDTWQAEGQIERHERTGFPLRGAHAAVSCHRCHPGGFVGNFLPTDHECLTCHMKDLARTSNPPHIPLGWVERCDRCHLPTKWNQGRIN